jgi:cell division septation protein DedD
MLLAMSYDQKSRPDDSPARRRVERVRLIRRRVVGGAVGLFAAVWLLITATLVAGNDPALAGSKTTAARHATSTTTTSATTPTATTATATTATTSAAPAPSPVTTQQS